MTNATYQIADIIVAGVAATATVGIGAIALFGETLKRWIYRPRLILELSNDEGDLTTITDGPRSRWFHLRLSNSCRAYPFRNASVYLLAVFVSRPGGEWARAWRGRVQLQWRHEEPRFSPSPYPSKSVGPEWESDIFHIRDGSDRVFLNPVIVPNNLGNVWPRDSDADKDRLRLLVQARADEDDSNPLIVDVFWGGQWKEGVVEFRSVSSIRTSIPDDLKALLA